MALNLPSKDLLEKSIRSELIKIAEKNYTLEDIYECLEVYVSNAPRLENYVKSLAMNILSAPSIKDSVHSVRYRLKDPLHLADKLVLKCLREDKNIKKKFLFTQEGIKDLGGVRILHLRREEWKAIHDYLVFPGQFSTIELSEKKCFAPIKRQKDYIKGGFSRSEVKFDAEKEYTSLHYIFREKNPGVYGHHHIEVQVRTIFEEGWGEIDHQMNYPHKANSIARGYLTSLNASAQVANEIASKTGTLLHLPMLIQWEAELKLERSANNIYCVTPSLDWVKKNLIQFINHVKESRGIFHYFVIDKNYETKKKYWYIKRRLQEKNVLDKVKISFVPDRMKKIPVVSDVLLLDKVCIKKNSVLTECDISVVGAPAQIENISPEEHLDMIIFDTESVNRTRAFFESLAN